MPVYAALLQGINIGSKKRIRMENLRSLIAGLGARDVRTYVNSGNVVFHHDEVDVPHLEARIEEALKEHIGVPVPTIIRTGAELATVVANNPFPEAVSEPKSLHVLFLRGMPADEAAEAATRLETGPDRMMLHDREVYFSLPNLLSGATIDVAKVGKVLGMDATSRNWSTVMKLAEMAKG